MGDDERRPAHHQPVERRLHNLFALRIEGAGGLVQNQDARVLQYSPGDGDALPLAAGKHQPPFPDLRVIALGQLHDELMGVGVFGRRLDFLVRGVQPAVTDIFPHRCGKEHRFLRHDADLRAKRLQRHIPDVTAVHQYSPGIHVVKPGNQIRDGGFARAGRADESNHLSPRGGK